MKLKTIFFGCLFLVGCLIWAGGCSEEMAQKVAGPVEIDTTIIVDTLNIESIDTLNIESIDTLFVTDSIFTVDTLFVTDSIFTVDTLYIEGSIDDTLYIEVPIYDTTFIEVPIYDTTFIEVPIYDTIFIYDTTFTDVFIHDTTFIYDTTVIHVHDTIFIEIPSECGECDGKITRLKLRYHGAGSALIKVFTKKKRALLFKGNVNPGAMFEFVGNDRHGTMGPEIYIYAYGLSTCSSTPTKIHTSCSKPIYIGMVIGDYEIIDGYSRNGGKLCR